MGAKVVLVPGIVGFVFLIAGIVATRATWGKARGIEKLVWLGPTFVAAPLAAFSMEHFIFTRTVSRMVPAWMPWHLFWAYFVGTALLAAALSFAAMKVVDWSAPLLAAMFLLFVILMDAPGTASAPHNRIFWILMFRELAFGAGVLAFAAAVSERFAGRTRAAAIAVSQFCVAVAMLLYGVQQLLHPYNVLGIPLEKLTPSWVPLHLLWAYCVGAVLVVTGCLLLIRKWSRPAAVTAGLLMVLLTAFFYIPILAVDHSLAHMVEDVNYVFDTLLLGGTTLLLAIAVGHPRSDLDKRSPEQG